MENKIEKIIPPSQETRPAPEKVFDKARFYKVFRDVKKLLRSETFGGKGSKEEINALSWEIAENVEI